MDVFYIIPTEHLGVIFTVKKSLDAFCHCLKQDFSDNKQEILFLQKNDNQTILFQKKNVSPSNDDNLRKRI